MPLAQHQRLSGSFFPFHGTPRSLSPIVVLFRALLTLVFTNRLYMLKVGEHVEQIPTIGKGIHIILDTPHIFVMSQFTKFELLFANFGRRIQHGGRELQVYLLNSLVRDILQANSKPC